MDHMLKIICSNVHLTICRSQCYCSIFIFAHNAHIITHSSLTLSVLCKLCIRSFVYIRICSVRYLKCILYERRTSPNNTLLDGVVRAQTVGGFYYYCYYPFIIGCEKSWLFPHMIAQMNTRCNWFEVGNIG